MTDRELLELAGKAAGIVQTKALLRSDLGLLVDKRPPTLYCIDCKVWNPLTDDGDALRLAVELQLDIEFIARDTVVLNVAEGGGDRYAATRRAIVRAAAKIGEQQQ